MLKLLLFTAFVANAILFAASTAVATATSTCDGEATTTAATETTTATNNPGQSCDGPNEHYEVCPDGCAPRNCSQLGFTIDCPAPNSNGSCTTEPACACEQGYARNGDGICIPTEQCPSCGGDKNAGPGCSNYCGNRCSDYNKGPVACAQYCIVNGCACKNGYVYDDNTKECVLPEKCTPICSSDEYFDSCVNGGCYDKRTCKDLDRNGTTICVRPKECKPGCLCKEGFLRNEQGKCVAENKCPNSKCKGVFETYVQCNTNCVAQTCDQLGFPLNCTTPTSNSSCIGKPGCVCTSGYVKDKTGKCIPQGQCPSCGGDKNAGPGCSNYCSKQCSDYNKGPIACPFYCQVNGCACNEGYIFDDNTKKCVLPEKCTKTCGQNEQYTTCVEGGCVSAVSNCSQITPGKDVPIVCKNPIKCTPGCICQNGFFRNSDGECVSKDDCLNEQCGKNEVYDTCVTSCPPRKCGIDDATVLCVPTNPDDCKAGCRCADGFSRVDNGECVATEDCAKTCNGANVEWDPCPDPCDPNTCESIGQEYNCPLQPAGEKQCNGACRCKEGYYKNKIGECISKENCLKCTKPFEYFSCGGACDNVCATLSQQNQTSCPIINIKCNEMCYCQEGYARDRQNNCVPISSCRNCTGTHEWYDKCSPNCPPTDDCSIYNKEYSCPAQIYNDTSNCKPACRCENNYLRKNGTCVPEEQCPCNGDDNAKPGCGCSRTCADFILNKQPTCTKICKVNACDCKDGYVLEEKSNKCVLPRYCPTSSTSCPKGQTFGCGDNCNRKCFNFRNGTSPIACARVSCTGIGLSCQCDPQQEYYYDDDKQKCVPSSECPP